MSSTKTYLKLQVHHPSANFSEATRIVQVPLTDPKHDEVRVKVIYAGVNATDVVACAARYYFTEKQVPFDVGLEAIGLIDSLGSSIDPSLINQPVLVALEKHRQNGYSEYLYRKPQNLIKLPSLNPAFLTALINGLTSSIGLDKSGGQLRSGDKVLITAAAGGTGMMAAQWAKHKGCYVIGTTSTEEKRDFLQEIGVDLVINYKTEDVDKILSDKFPDGLDVIWETIGGDTFKMLFNHLSTRGRLVVIGGIDSYRKKTGMAHVDIENWNVTLLTGSKTVSGFILYDYSELYAEYLSKLIKMIENGEINARVDLGDKCPGGVFEGLESVHRAIDWLYDGGNVGKVVVRVNKILDRN